ncbi:MAG: phytoene desaturase family protein [Chitinophagaceae bacterium]|nr:phytoene desaturase family protein [Chitinophagaceae bacterium]
MDNRKHAIVIGAGIAGLASSIRLSCMGWRVSVFEKNSYPGGKLSSFDQDGYRFDAGPSLFTQPQNIEELFAFAGEPIDHYFKYQRVPVTCTYFFSNGKKLTAWAERKKFADEMHSVLGEPRENIYNYLDNASELYENVGELFLKHSLHRPGDFSVKEIAKALQTVKFPHLFKTLGHYNGSVFATPEAAQLFNRYATYNGSNPYSAPAMLSLIPHLEMNEGTFYPEGGMISITNALYQLALKKGVAFFFDSPVDSIKTEKGKVEGVYAGGAFYGADMVVSNQDVYFTYKHLLKQEAKAAKLLKQERSSSALIFYWGIGRNFEQLGLHNIFFSADYQEEFRHIFQTGDVWHDPTIYINITSKMEAGLAPEGKENWFVMVNVPANRGQNWEALKPQVRKAVINKLSTALQADIAALIETEAVLDPIAIEAKTRSYMGSLYGTSSNSRFAAFLRHPNFSKDIKGLFFVGGSVHPGGGIPLCLRSAAIMANIAGPGFSIKTV